MVSFLLSVVWAELRLLPAVNTEALKVLLLSYKQILNKSLNISVIDIITLLHETKQR